MLAGKFRLSGTYYIDRAKQKGKLLQFNDFGICIYKRSEEDDGKPPRFAFVISTKVSKHAVDRNRVKRIISETVRYETKHLKTGYDVVYLAKPSIATRPADEIMKQVKESLKKGKLLTS